MTARHIRDGEGHIFKQNEIIDRLRALGADTTLATQIMAQLRDTLEMHRQHHDRLAAETDAPG